jgi:hypothetical protein
MSPQSPVSSHLSPTSTLSRLPRSLSTCSPCPYRSPILSARFFHVFLHQSQPRDRKGRQEATQDHTGLLSLTSPCLFWDPRSLFSFPCSAFLDVLFCYLSPERGSCPWAGTSSPHKCFNHREIERQSWEGSPGREGCMGHLQPQSRVGMGGSKLTLEPRAPILMWPLQGPSSTQGLIPQWWVLTSES